MEIIKKQHHLDLLPGDVAETVFLPGDISRAKLIADHFDEAHFVAKKRQYNTYTGTYQGVPVSVTSTGIGGPAVAIAVEELIKVGAKNFIRIGTGGLLQTWLPVPGLIIATAVVRGDGTSREYFPLEYPAVADWQVVEAMVQAAEKRDIQAFPGITRGHDTFYAESIFGDFEVCLERDRQWIDSNVLITSNEASTLFPLAMVRGCRAGAIEVGVDCHIRPYGEATADEVATAIDQAIKISLDAAVTLYHIDRL